MKIGRWIFSLLRLSYTYRELCHVIVAMVLLANSILFSGLVTFPRCYDFLICGLSPRPPKEQSNQNSKFVRILLYSVHVLRSRVRGSAMHRMVHRYRGIALSSITNIYNNGTGCNPHMQRRRREMTLRTNLSSSSLTTASDSTVQLLKSWLEVLQRILQLSHSQDHLRAAQK